MKYKLFISDYDGTLGKAPKNDIDSETLKAINRFTQKGGIFAVCSGRETASISKILKAHSLKGLVVSFQGARITDLNSGKTLFEGGLNSNDAVQIIIEMKKSGLGAVAYGEKGFFVEEITPYVKAYELATGLTATVTDVEKVLKEQKENVCKVCGLGAESIVDDCIIKFNEKYKGTSIKFNSGEKCLLEAINIDCSKGKAVRFLASYYGVSLSDVIAVGDSTNDIELISGEWHGVAVGDGRKELKAVADEITVPFDDKPIKYLLEKYCL